MHLSDFTSLLWSGAILNDNANLINYRFDSLLQACLFIPTQESFEDGSAETLLLFYLNSLRCSAIDQPMKGEREMNRKGL